MIYVTIFHNKNNIKKYIKILKKKKKKYFEKKILRQFQVKDFFKPINRIN